MKVIKYGHACIVLEENGKRLVIDPGNLSDEFGGSDNVAGVVVTHIHPDHFDPGHLADIKKHSPDAIFFSTPEVADQPSEIPITAVRDGFTTEVEPFHLRFYGEKHEPVLATLTLNDNSGVLVNGTFYYPGDSFTMPEGAQVHTLALPVSAPWLKLSEAIDFMRAVKPQVCIPTHTAILSDAGHEIIDRLLGTVCMEYGIKYVPLHAGKYIEI